jgi:hypothetical protein
MGRSTSRNLRNRRRKQQIKKRLRQQSSRKGKFGLRHDTVRVIANVRARLNRSQAGEHQDQAQAR